MPSWIRLTPPSELLRVTHTFLPVRIVGQAHKLCARCLQHSRMWLSPYPLGERETLPCPGVTPCATIRKWWDTCKGLLIDLTHNNHFVQNGHMMWTWLLHSKVVSRPNWCWCKVWPKIWPLLIPLFVGCNNSLSLGEGVTYCMDVLPTATSPVTTICKYSFSAGNVNSCEIMFFDVVCAQNNPNFQKHQTRLTIPWVPVVDNDAWSTLLFSSTDSPESTSDPTHVTNATDIANIHVSVEGK